MLIINSQIIYFQLSNHIYKYVIHLKNRELFFILISLFIIYIHLFIYLFMYEFNNLLITELITIKIYLMFLINHTILKKKISN